MVPLIIGVKPPDPPTFLARAPVTGRTVSAASANGEGGGHPQRIVVVDVADQDVVARRKVEGERRGVSQTPSFVIGGQLYAGALGFDQFNKIVETELAKPRPAAAPADSVPADAKKPAVLAPASTGK